MYTHFNVYTSFGHPWYIFEMHWTLLCSLRFATYCLSQSQEILFFRVSPTYLGHLLTPNQCARTNCKHVFNCSPQVHLILTWLLPSRGVSLGFGFQALQQDAGARTCFSVRSQGFRWTTAVVLLGIRKSHQLILATSNGTNLFCSKFYCGYIVTFNYLVLQNFPDIANFVFEDIRNSLRTDLLFSCFQDPLILPLKVQKKIRYERLCLKSLGLIT